MSTKSNLLRETVDNHFEGQLIIHCMNHARRKKGLPPFSKPRTDHGIDLVCAGKASKIFFI
jgi:hypothetical protein